jgi:hypothetical protein
VKLESSSLNNDRIYRLVRLHWNRPRFQAIKRAFEATYRTTLRRRVEGEVSCLHLTESSDRQLTDRPLGSTRKRWWALSSRTRKDEGEDTKCEIVVFTSIVLGYCFLPRDRCYTRWNRAPHVGSDVPGDSTADHTKSISKARSNGRYYRRVRT